MSTITFPSNGGTTSGYLAEPSAMATAVGTPPGGVVVIQEWWGLNDHIEDICERFAAEGFTALAPDLYREAPTDEPDEAQKRLMALDIDAAAADLRGAVDHLTGLLGKPPAILGFCMGGALALYAACEQGAAIAACVDFYGAHPAVTYNFDSLTAPVLAHWAEDDDFANAGRPAIEAALAERNHAYEGITYEETHHAFVNDTRYETFDRAATDRSWQRTTAFLRHNL